MLPYKPKKFIQGSFTSEMIGRDFLGIYQKEECNVHRKGSTKISTFFIMQKKCSVMNEWNLSLISNHVSN